VNSFNFSGRLAAAPVLTNHGDSKVCKFTVIANEYAGKDKESGDSLERTTSIRFTAFNKKAIAIAENFFKGDQIILSNAHVQNNDYTDGAGKEVYGYDYVVDDFDFGAPGPEKREQLAKRST
jgi:single-strand DNA-binding protein